MKALSLTQPWACAIAHRLKRWETRSWPTTFRGELALHAAKHLPAWAIQFAEEEGLLQHGLPRGVIIAVCELTECRKTQDVRGKLSDLELKWGDFADGRYAFKLENVRSLIRPVPVKGMLGLWKVPPDVERQVREQL